MKRRHIGLFLLSAMVAFATHADVLTLKAGHPESYIVKRGDTLWDISGHFLKQPWLWPRLWRLNPQIHNPDLIYPGDRLSLVWVDGEPRLVRKSTIRLSPKVRIEPKTAPITTLSLADIGPFLKRDHLFDRSLSVDVLPRVLGENRNSLGMLAGQTLFVEGELAPGTDYGIYRPGTAYQDKDSGEYLGQEAIFVGVGVAEPRVSGGRSAIAVTSTVREIRQGDRLLSLPEQEHLDAYFTPKPAQLSGQGYIMDTAIGGRGAGKYDLVWINKGQRDGVAPGDVMAVWRPGTTIVHLGDDEVAYAAFSGVGERLLHRERERFPAARIGELMVFKTYDKMSMALVVSAGDMVQQGYAVGNP